MGRTRCSSRDSTIGRWNRWSVSLPVMLLAPLLLAETDVKSAERPNVVLIMANNKLLRSL